MHCDENLILSTCCIDFNLNSTHTVPYSIHHRQLSAVVTFLPRLSGVPNVQLIVQVCAVLPEKLISCYLTV